MNKKIFFIFLISIILFSTSCEEDTSVVRKSKGFIITKIEDGYPHMPLNIPAKIYKHSLYHFCYSTNLKASYWVAYILTKKMVEGQNLNRENEIFMPDPLLDKEFSAATNDYTRSGYDRGHLCPNGDMNFDQKSMTETFYLSNVLPQKPSFNRGIWAALEEQVRKWASVNDSLYVITGGIFTKKPNFIGKNKIAVPSHFYKIVADISRKGGYKMIAFVMENKDYENKNFYQYAVPVSKIEQMTGIKFFPSGDTITIEIFKSTLRLTDWQ